MNPAPDVTAHSPRLLLRTLGALLLLGTSAGAQVGAPFCFGDVCPCGNTDSTAGCGNLGEDGDLGTGALLESAGSADVYSTI